MTTGIPALPAGGATDRCLTRLGLPLDHVARAGIVSIDDGDDQTTRAAALAFERASRRLSTGSPSVGGDRPSGADAVDPAIERGKAAREVSIELAQSVVDPYVQRARALERSAADASGRALDVFDEARRTAHAVLELPHEVVPDPTWGGLTRAQIRDLREQNQNALAIQLAAGERRAVVSTPGPAVQWALTAAVCAIESWLITLRLVNFSVYDRASWLTFAAFTVVLVLGTHYLTGEAGAAIAAHREAHQADKARAGGGGARSTSPTAAAERRMRRWLVVVSMLAGVYATTSFLRVYQMAERLPGWPHAFPLVVAALFSGVAVAVLGLVAYWRGQRSGLRADVDRSIALDELTMQRQALLRSAAVELLAAGEAETARAARLRMDAEAMRTRGVEKVVRSAQKLAALLDEPSTPAPARAALFGYDAPFAAESLRLATAGAAARGDVEALLAAQPDFTPSVRVLSPWTVLTSGDHEWSVAVAAESASGEQSVAGSDGSTSPAGSVGGGSRRSSTSVGITLALALAVLGLTAVVLFRSVPPEMLQSVRSLMHL